MAAGRGSVPGMRKTPGTVAVATSVMAALVAVTATVILLCAVMVNASRHLPPGLSWPGYTVAVCAGAAWLGALYIAVRELVRYLGLDPRAGRTREHTVVIDGLRVRPRALQNHDADR